MDNLIGRQPYNEMVGNGFLADKGKKASSEEEQVGKKTQELANPENKQLLEDGLNAAANINRALIGMPQMISLNNQVDFSKMSNDELIRFAQTKLGSQRASEIEEAVTGEFENGVNKAVDQIKSDPELVGFQLTNAQIYAAAARAFAQ